MLAIYCLSLDYYDFGSAIKKSNLCTCVCFSNFVGLLGWMASSFQVFRITVIVQTQ